MVDRRIDTSINNAVIMLLIIIRSIIILVSRQQIITYIIGCFSVQLAMMSWHADILN